jgi:hypothetical protein
MELRLYCAPIEKPPAIYLERLKEGTPNPKLESTESS